MLCKLSLTCCCIAFNYMYVEVTNHQWKAIIWLIIKWIHSRCIIHDIMNLSNTMEPHHRTTLLTWPPRYYGLFFVAWAAKAHLLFYLKTLVVILTGFHCRCSRNRFSGNRWWKSLDILSEFLKTFHLCVYLITFCKNDVICLTIYAFWCQR